MDNVISKMVAILLAVFLICIIPSLYTQILIERIIENEIHTETKTFLEQVRAKGYITKEHFEHFLKKIVSANGVTDVELIHRKSVFIPDDLSLVGYKEIYLGVEGEQIMATIEREGRYCMEKEDEFIITVMDKSKKGSNIFLTKIFSITNPPTFIRYGGIIKNESE